MSLSWPLVLPTVPRPDYITLSGSGEPTLNLRLGQVIDGIRQITDVPVAIITNGTLLSDPDVRPVPPERLALLARLLGPKAEVVADFKSRQAAAASAIADDQVLAMIRRRPVTYCMAMVMGRLLSGDPLLWGLGRCMVGLAPLAVWRRGPAVKRWPADVE